MASRHELQEEFYDILGNRNVYYQPPESVKMRYPAIVFKRNDIRNVFADNKVYSQSHSYQVMVIDHEADSEIADKISKFPMCKFDRCFTSDGLYHHVFIISY